MSLLYYAPRGRRSLLLVLDRLRLEMKDGQKLAKKPKQVRDRIGPQPDSPVVVFLDVEMQGHPAGKIYTYRG
jgi:hypothetical protein